MCIWEIPVPSKTTDGHDAAHRILHERMRRFVYVADFGAVGDGGTDNTVMLQNAINRAEGGVVLLPPGVFITGSLVLPTGTNVIGSGGSTILKLKNGTNAALFRNSNVTQGNTDIRISDLTIDGNRINQARATAHGIQLINAHRVTIERCNLFDCGFDAIYIGMSGLFGGQAVGGGCSDILISGNHIARPRRNGISVTRGERITIVDNDFEACNIGTLEDPVYDAGSIDLEPNNSVDTVTNIIIKNNRIRDSYQRSIQIAANSDLFENIIIEGNQIVSGPGGGIVTFSNTARLVSIINNHIVTEKNQNGILVGYLSSNFRIDGNIIKGGGKGVVITNGGTYMVVSNNTIIGASQGVQLASAAGNCDYINVLNNTLVGCSETIITGNATNVVQTNNTIW